MATVESYLTRELNLRFIDARRISAEAKLSLGIYGYPTQEQIHFIKQESVRIFNEMPKSERKALQTFHLAFEAKKTSVASDMSGDSSDADSSDEGRSRRSTLVSLFRRSRFEA